MYLHFMYIHIPMSTPRQPRKTLRTDAKPWSRPAPAGTAVWPPGASASSSTASWRRFTSPRRRLGLMAQIAVIPDDTLGGLARRTGLEQSTLSRNLRTLESAGLIEITLVETDLRRRAVWLTEAGARRLEAAIPVWRRAHAKLVEASLARPGPAPGGRSGGLVRGLTPRLGLAEDESSGVTRTRPSMKQGSSSRRPSRALREGRSPTPYRRRRRAAGMPGLNASPSAGFGEQPALRDCRISPCCTICACGRGSCPRTSACKADPRRPSPSRNPLRKRISPMLPRSAEAALPASATGASSEARDRRHLHDRTPQFARTLHPVRAAGSMAPTRPGLWR